GDYFLGAYVDHDGLIAETTVANNVAYYPVTVPPPDLQTVAAGVSSANLLTEQAFTTWATVQNIGSIAEPGTLRYFLSPDAQIDTGDTELGTDATPVIEGAGAEALGQSVTAPATPGTYWVGACVDGVAGETNLSNQCSWAIEITVQERPPGC
ncbi:MAG: hypothetical protein R3228_18440, partial [Halioglobus sp.]|nr:hypothetical protein [Halioglobus sp.]